MEVPLVEFAVPCFGLLNVTLSGQGEDFETARICFGLGGTVTFAVRVARPMGLLGWRTQGGVGTFGLGCALRCPGCASEPATLCYDA